MIAPPARLVCATIYKIPHDCLKQFADGRFSLFLPGLKARQRPGHRPTAPRAGDIARSRPEGPLKWVAR